MVMARELSAILGLHIRATLVRTAMQSIGRTISLTELGQSAAANMQSTTNSGFRERRNTRRLLRPDFLRLQYPPISFPLQQKPGSLCKRS